MLFRGFKQAHEKVREACVRTHPSGNTFSISEFCCAMDLSCVFYFKQVFCLQRSAATVLLLRSYGWDAELVIGTQVLPLRSHAWVEIKGLIVNDKPYMTDIYQVLTRC